MRQASGSRGEELDCQRYVALDDLVDECSGAPDLHVSIERPAPIPPRLLVHMRRWEKRRMFATCFVEFNGKPVASVKKGFRSAVNLAKLPGKVTPAYPSSYSHDPAHAARRADLGGSRFPKHVARGPAGPLRALPPPIICKALRPQSSKKAGMFRWLNRWLTRE